MRTFAIATATIILINSALLAQEKVVPDPAGPQTEISTEAPESVEVPDTNSGDAMEAPETDEPASVQLNTSKQQKLSRLAMASGLTEEAILAMRNGTEMPADETQQDGAEPPEETGMDAPETEETEEGKTGWGRIALDLGLHPGILGNGTGDKFLPDDLPEIDGEARTAVATARERAMERKVDKQELRSEAKAAGRKAKAAGRKAKPDKARRAERPAKQRPDKARRPERAGKPDITGKGKSK